MGEITDFIKHHGLTPKKSLGQNFILDPQILKKIVRFAGDIHDATIIEIGPGPGGLTKALLDTGAKKVIAIEKDKRCYDALLNEIKDPRLTIIYGDATSISLETLFPPPIQIVANLPYNVATVLLFKLLPKIQHFRKLTLMFQKEVALRLNAKVGSSSYGRLSVMVGWVCEVRLLWDLPASVFIPPPRVTSSLVEIKPRFIPLGEQTSWENMELVVKHAFHTRRKMLRSSLKTLGVNVESLLEKAQINGTLRAENLAIEDFTRLAATFATLKKIVKD